MTKFTVEQGAYMGAIKLFFMRQKEKVRLKKAFKNAGLIIKHKSGDVEETLNFVELIKKNLYI